MHTTLLVRAIAPARLRQFAAPALARIVALLRRRATVAALEGLDDHQLDDIGCTRERLPHITLYRRRSRAP